MHTDSKRALFRIALVAVLGVLIVTPGFLGRSEPPASPTGTDRPAAAEPDGFVRALQPVPPAPADPATGKPASEKSSTLEAAAPDVIRSRGTIVEQTYEAQGVTLKAGGHSLRIRLTEVIADNGSLPLGTSAPQLSEGDSPRVVYRYGDALREEYVSMSEGVEQVFVIAQPLAAPSDVTFRVSLATQLAARLGSSPADAYPAVAFAAVDESVVFRYGHATAIDAAGRREVLRYALDNGELAMTVSAGFMSKAAYPVIVDPLIGANFPIAALDPDPERIPDVVYDSSEDRYLIVYEREYGPSDFDVHAAVVGPNGNLLSTALPVADSRLLDSRKPRVATSNANNFLITWEERPATGGDWEVVGCLASISGGSGVTLVGPKINISSNVTADDGSADVGFSTTENRFLVAWVRRPAGQKDLRGCTVSTTGTLGTSFAIQDLPGIDEESPSVSPLTGNPMGVAWVRRNPAGAQGDIWYASVDVSVNPPTVTGSSPANTDARNEIDPCLGSHSSSASNTLVWSLEWSASDFDVQAKRGSFLSGGPSFGTPFWIDTSSANAIRPSVAVTSAALDREAIVFGLNPAGWTAALWDVGGGVFRRSSGAWIESLSASTAGNGQYSPAVAVRNTADTSEALVAFENMAAGNADIYGQLARLSNPTIFVSAADPFAGEPGTTYGTGTFTITSSVAPASDLTVYYSVSASATAGTDYVALSGTVVLPAGSTSATIAVTAIDDADPEWSEQIAITLQGGTGYTLGTPTTATIWLYDDDVGAAVWASDPSASEPAGPYGAGAFTVYRTGPVTAALAVNYVVEGVASAGIDYVALPGVVTIPAGFGTATIPVTVIDDGLLESWEGVVVTVVAGPGYQVMAPSYATVTIYDDEPVVGINATDSSAGEPAIGSGTGTFTVTRTGSTANVITVSYSIAGTASDGTDYAALAGNVSIPAGATSATITISPLDDAIVEGSETVILTLSGGSGYSIGFSSTATVTIADDEPVVLVSATDASAGEPASGLGTGTFQFSRTGSTVNEITVNYAVSGTATAGSDYAALSGSVTIPAAASAATVILSVLDDGLIEGDETVVVTVSGGAGYTIAIGTSATVAIADDEPAVSVFASDSSAGEPSTGYGNGSFRVTRAGSTVAAITVSYDVAGSATAGADYTALSGTVTIGAGSTEAFVPVVVLDDALFESTETVVVTLSAGAGYRIGAISSATVTIADDEPVVTIMATDPSGGEPATGLGNGVFTVTRTGATTAALTVNYAVAGTATPGSDYIALTGSLTIPIGSFTTSFPAAVMNDTLVEDSETVVVTLAVGPGYVIGSTSTATVTIADDEPTVQIIGVDSSGGEPVTGLGDASFNISRSGSTTAAITVAYSVAGTAQEGSDFTALSGTATIPVGSISVTITVAVLDDALVEPTETVVLTVAAGAGYRIGGAATATLTIADDEPTVTITPTDGAASEPAGGAGDGTLTVTRSGSTVTAITVNYSLSGTASPGLDYAALSGTVDIPAGAPTAAIVISVLDDSLVEGNESVVVTLAGGAGYNVGVASSAAVGIGDDEPTVTVTPTDSFAGEPATTYGTATFAIARTGSLLSAITVNYDAGGTATAGADYSALPGTVTIPAGSASATITVTPLDDALYEGDETVRVTLAGGNGYSIGIFSTDFVTIVDDEATVSISGTDTSAGEPASGAGTATVVVTRTGSTALPLDVNYVATGTAGAGADYVALPGVLTIPAGSLNAAITVTALDDSILEQMEWITISLASSPSYSIGWPAFENVYLYDDEPRVSIQATDATAGEPDSGSGNGTFTVSRLGSTLSALTVTYSVAGTATAGSDYTALPGSVTIAAGSASATITVAVLDDIVPEASESVTVTLTLGAGYDFGGFPTSATVSIADDEPVVTISATDAAAGEPGAAGGNGSFTVTRTGPTASPLTVNYNVAGTATSGSDFTALTGTVTIAAGSSTETIALTVLDDNLFEGSETVVVMLAAGAYAPGTPSMANVTIADDDDLVTIAATDAGAGEPLTGNGGGTFTVTRAGPLGAALSVNYTVAGTAATDGSDYTVLSGTLTIPAAAATATITVAVVDDALAEGNETVIVTLATGAGYEVGPPSTATVTIADDETTVSITATDAAAGEPASGNASGTFTVTRTGPTAVALAVSYTVSGASTATAGTDYTTLAGSLTIPAGSASADIAVDVIDDTDVETEETLEVVLSAGAGYVVVSPSSAAVTIADDEPRVGIAATDATAGEPVSGLGGGTFTVTRVGSTALAVTVNYSVDVASSASAGSDYTSLPLSVTIPAAATTATIPLTVLDDDSVETIETVTVNLSPGAGYEVAAPSGATVTIADDEPIVSIAATDAAAGEPLTGFSTGRFTVMRTGSTLAAITVNYAVGGTAAAGDYTGLSTSVTIAAGSTTAAITVTATDDALYEGNETVVVTLATGTGYTIGLPVSATVTIADDESQITIAATDAFASEPVAGAGSGVFTVTRTGFINAPLTVNYASGGTATSGFDYTALTGSVTIPSGFSTATVTLSVLDDTVAEGFETVVLTLIAGTGYELGSPVGATVTIIDDESTVTVSATDAAAGEPGEGSGNGQFTVSRAGSTAFAVTVSYTIGGTALAGTDYTALTGSVTISAGATAATIPVIVTDDGLYEPAETVIVALVPTTEYNVGLPASATVTIADDESLVTVTATDAAAGEPATGSGSGQFTVSRTGAIAAALTVNYTVGGTAASGTDYTALAGSVTIPAGLTTATIAVDPLDDTVVEASETVTVTLAAGTGYEIGAPASAIVTISDDEPNVTIVATDAAAGEPGTSAGTGTLTLTRAGSTAFAITVNYTVGGTASSGSDYTALAGSVTIPAASTSETITLSVVDDSIPEGYETVIVTLAAGTGYAVGFPSSATVAIEDDEPTISIAATDSVASEPGISAGGATFTLTRAGSTASAVNVTYIVSGTATSGSDFSPLSGSVTIPAAATTATVTVTVLNDTLGEPDETVVLTLTAGAGYAIGTPSSASATIFDDEILITVYAPIASASEPAEGSTTAIFGLNRTGLDSAITVNYTISGTATPGSDFAALSGTVTIPTGFGGIEIAVDVLDDSDVETTETVILTLAPGAGYEIGTPSSATITIADDEPILSIAATDATAGEPASGSGDGLLTITRTGSTVSAITVNYAVSGTATAAVDYLALSGTATIPAGSTTVTIPLSVIDDADVESSETVAVTLTAGTGYTVGTPSGTSVSIADDEPYVSIAATDATAGEPATGSGGGLFTITRTGSTLSAITVTYTVGGTAAADADYIRLSGTATIAAGASATTITVTALDDSVGEGSETVVATLATESGYSLRTPSTSTVTIEDDEVTVSIYATDPDAGEPGTGLGTGTFTVTRTGPLGASLLLDYVIGGTAAAGDDYAALSGSLTIPAGSTWATIDIDTFDDLFTEGCETIEVTLSPGAGYEIVLSPAATVTLYDDERPENDDFSGAIPIDGTSQAVRGANVNATEETGEPDHAGNVGGSSVWWSWTAPASGTVTVSTEGSTFDTLLAIYTGGSVSTLVLVSANDDSEGDPRSRAVFGAIAGTTYWIVVDGANSGSGAETGGITLTLEAPAATLVETNPAGMCGSIGFDLMFPLAALWLLRRWRRHGRTLLSAGLLLLSVPMSALLVSCSSVEEVSCETPALEETPPPEENPQVEAPAEQSPEPAELPESPQPQEESNPPAPQETQPPEEPAEVVKPPEPQEPAEPQEARPPEQPVETGPAEPQEPVEPQEPGEEAPVVQEPPEEPWQADLSEPFIDFGESEFSPFLGVVVYAPHFEAFPAAAGGLFWRAPAPGIWEPLSLFAEVGASQIERDIDAVVNGSGTVLWFGGGLDFAFLRNDEYRLSAQVGATYTDFGDVTDLGSGGGLLLGGMAALNLGGRVWLTYNPQFVTAFFDPDVDEGDWYFANVVGIDFQF